MWHRQLLVFGICGLITMKVARSSPSLRFNGATSAGSQNPPLKLEMNAWQPFTQHNNWLILQATAPSSMPSAREEIRERRKENEPEPELERLPVNFYAYNHRYNESSPPAGGNYKQVSPSDPASYVLAISQQMRRGQLLRQLPNAEEAEPEVREVTHPSNAVNNGDEDDDENEILPLEDGAGERASLRGIESYLAPFEGALIKVRNFCDILRSVISDETDEAGSNKLDATTSGTVESAAATTAPPGAQTTSKDLLVQGRAQSLASESEGRKLKKLKKKIQKLFFPLLIAYKLKFLTLIPVLIGGLTLLVGTTGLAGFFFALFTAVMSLKTSGGGGHASKSLVLKKL
ncbi:uncharacterized protein LOC128261323 [Drosophila gunungcola]|uniref:Osiris 20 n=1 Tax=Drosophila gunungcola TaxID=103775 RepID=A0A9P9YWV2_9MUSC|nr:uncharacterized protein LOC128261323 [Drosophila gunungcola]XP_052850937.1 uncharacterized protein LOC128261323 [Drosophila gunungcola]KAI8044338.1 hypothetical protein M5D96_000494 [Drosophila gunungcola]